MNIIEWITQNYGIIIVLLIILLIVFHQHLAQFISRIFSKKKKDNSSQIDLPEFPSPDLQGSLFQLEENALFDDIQKKDALAIFQQQKKIAEKNISLIKAEGKRLVQEEKRCVYEYSQKKNKLYYDKQQLGMKYTTWVNQLNSLNHMIANQMHMNEELKKLKEEKE